MREDELSPTLRRVYAQEPETAEPSEALWHSTRKALHERGLVTGVRQRRLMRVSAAAVLAAATFVGGILVGAGLSREEASGPSTRGASTPTDPATAAEFVQQAGTTYALALESLVQSLDDANARDIAVGQEVVLSVSRAYEKPARLLVTAAADEREAVETATDEPLIWF